MPEWISSITALLDVNAIVTQYGLPVLLAIIFLETGMPFGFFFPGDSLLFTAGLLAGTPATDGSPGNVFDINLAVLLITVYIAAVAGNFAGYWFGKYSGPRLFKRDDSWLFKKKYLTMTENFYARKGGPALIMGRFVPIIRTFVPILAGAIKLDFKKFIWYNMAGAFLWTNSFILAGYLLGHSYPGISKYLHYIIGVLILITLIPVVITFLKEKRLAKALENQVGQVPERKSNL